MAFCVHARTGIVAGIIAAVLAGCSADRPLNPSFPLTVREAKGAVMLMKDDPKPLARPVIVLGGIYDPGFVADHLADTVRDVATNDELVLEMSFFLPSSIEKSAGRLVARINERFPSADPATTVEVDVLAFSMGGLVAREAASAGRGSQGRQLRIARLFTISSPHRGAKLAWLPLLDRRLTEMRRDSGYLARLNAEPVNYEIFAYARLNDGIVGEENAAAPGREAPWWVATSFLAPAHLFAAYDKRILADILRRLRGETPFTVEPPAPLPER